MQSHMRHDEWGSGTILTLCRRALLSGGAEMSISCAKMIFGPGDEISSSESSLTSSSWTLWKVRFI